METFLRMLDFPMQRPPLYGWYHLLWWGIAFAAAWLLCRLHQRSRDPALFARRVVFYTAVTVAFFEVLHHMNYHLIWADGAVRVRMQWYAFPFQFCSTPMYVGLLTGLFRQGRVHDSLCAYLATYAVFAGGCVMVYPGDVFTDRLVTNIECMVCHASMLTEGIFLYSSGHVKAEKRTLLRAMPVFAVCAGIAIVLNEIAFRSGLIAAGHTFNMFFFSPYCAPSLPVYSLVQQAVPYPFCLLIYVCSFTLAAGLVLLAAMKIGLNRLRRTKKVAEAT